MLPGQTVRRSGKKWLWITCGGIGLATIIALVWAVTRGSTTRNDILLYTVAKTDLDVTVTEKGTLESALNKDVVCRVKTLKGSNTSIKWVIDDGTKVFKGDKILELDDSALQDSLRAQVGVVDSAYSAMITAEEDYLQIEKTCEDDIKKKREDYALTIVDLEKYLGIAFDPSLKPFGAVAGAMAALTESGEYRQQYDDQTGQVRLAEGDVEQNRERSAWADRMVKMQYMSPAQAQAERSRLESSLEKLRSLQNQKAMLSTHTRRRTLTDLRSKMDAAGRALEIAIEQAPSKKRQAEVKRENLRYIYLQQLKELHFIQSQIQECHIYAAQDGMVVYFKNESSRFGANTQGLIEQGAQVKEGQKLLRIPNLEQMQVNTKIHEATIARIRADVRVSKGIFDSFRTGLSMNTDLFGRLIGQHAEVLHEIEDQVHEIDFEYASKGQRATVRVDAMPDRVLKGRVKSKAEVASQTDSWASDIKLYQTLVLIEEPVEGLKPDMTAEVTIYIDAAKEKVLAIPLQAVVGGAEQGATRTVYVKTADGHKAREVKLGLYNEKMVEVQEGLAEGDQVVLNPKVLLGDSKLKTRDAEDKGAGKDGASKDGKDGKDGKKGSGKKKGGGKGPPTGMGTH